MIASGWAPIVGMGVMNADNPELLRRAFDVGVRHFDTAAYYERGRNEERVGRVIEEVGGRIAADFASANPDPAFSVDRNG